MSETTTSFDRISAYLGPVCIGLSVPAVAFGNATIAPFLGIAILLGFGMLMRSKADLDRLKVWLPRDVVWAIVVVLLAWLVSAAVSEHPAKAISTVLRSSGLIFMSVLFAVMLARDHANLVLALKVLIASATVVLGYIASTFFVSDGFFILVELVRSDPGLPSQFFKAYSSVVVCLLPVLVWAGFYVGGRWRWVALACVLFGIGAIIGGGRFIDVSRSAIAGMVGGLLMMFLAILIRSIRPGRLLAWVMGIALAVATVSVVMWFLAHLPTPPVGINDQPELPFPDWHRQIIWGFTLQVIGENMMLGVGPNTVNMTSGAAVIIPDLNQEYIPSHPHNWVLEIAAETGVLGISVLFAAMLVVLRHMLLGMFRRRAGSLASFGLFGAFWVSSLANFSIWSAWWLAALAVLASILMAVSTSKKPPRRKIHAEAVAD